MNKINYITTTEYKAMVELPDVYTFLLIDGDSDVLESAYLEVFPEKYYFLQKCKLYTSEDIIRVHPYCHNLLYARNSRKQDYDVFILTLLVNKFDTICKHIPTAKLCLDDGGLRLPYLPYLVHPTVASHIYIISSTREA